jgi:hypothetical protein
MTEKFNPSERHNVGDNVGPDSGRGFGGWGDTEIGAALSLGESGPDFIMEIN